MQLEDAITQYTNQSISTIHHALRASRRRLVVALVAHEAIHESEEDERIEFAVRDLARHITAIEEDTTLTHATGDPYRSAYTALCQTHLPELDKIQALDYDPDRKTVSPGQNLLPLAMMTAISSPVAQLFFHASIADLYVAGTTDPADSITD